MLQKIKNDVVLSSIMYLVIGILLIARPGFASVTLVHILALIPAVMGVGMIVMHFISGSMGSGDLIRGVIYIVIAIVVYGAAGLIVSLIPFALGVLMLMSGVVKLNEAVNLKKEGFASWIVVGCIAVLGIVFGILAIVNPFSTAELLIRIMGIGLVYNAASDLLTVFYFSKKTKYR